eukprot:512503-Prorocentrum_lima.AAC.1
MALSSCSRRASSISTSNMSSCSDLSMSMKQNHLTSVSATLFLLGRTTPYSTVLPQWHVLPWHNLELVV